MDDEVRQGWFIDAEVRTAMRLDAVRRQLDRSDYSGAVIEAEELLDEVPDHAEALDLLSEALLAIGDAEGAADALEQYLQVGGIATAAVLARLAVARLEACDLLGATEAAREAIRLESDRAEAHYALGLALERLPGRSTEAVRSFHAAFALEPESYPFPLELSSQDWERAVSAAVQRVPLILQTFWEGVPVQLHELPEIEELQGHDPPVSPTVAGMYLGDPPDAPDLTIRPFALRLFTRNLSRIGQVDELIDRIADVLESEALNWLGIDAEDLEEMLE